MIYQQNLIRGAVYIIISELMFASMGAVVKAVSFGLPNETVVFMRNLFGVFVLLPLLSRYGSGYLKTKILHLHMLRALLGLSAMYCFFYALAHLHLANGMLLKMTAPLFIPIAAYLWLAESVNRIVLFAIPLGFIGVILILQPSGDFSWVAFIGLLGGAFAAVAKVSVRRLGRSEPTVRIVFYFALIASLVSAVPLIWAWQTPQWNEWLLLFLMGLFGTLGQLFLTRGYGIATPARVGAFTYASVVFAAIYGYLFWGETLDSLFVIGAMLIALAGVMALRSSKMEKPAKPEFRFDSEPV